MTVAEPRGKADCGALRLDFVSRPAPHLLSSAIRSDAGLHSAPVATGKVHCARNGFKQGPELGQVCSHTNKISLFS